MKSVSEGPQAFGDGTFGFVDPLGVSWVFVGRVFIGGVLMADDADEGGATTSNVEAPGPLGVGFQVGDQVWVFRRSDNVASLN